MSKKVINVNDLGIAAFMMLKNYNVVGRKNRAVLFEVEGNEEEEFCRVKFDYCNGPFHRFDSCLMALKKIGNYLPKQTPYYVHDLGVAAYLMMHGFALAGRQSQTVYFEVPDIDINEFEKLSFEYLNSDYHRFDVCLMSIKKIVDKGEDNLNRMLCH